MWGGSVPKRMLLGVAVLPALALSISAVARTPRKQVQVNRESGRSFAQASSALRRQLEDLRFEPVADTPETRSHFPFLIRSLDEARRFNSEFPNAVPTVIHMALIERSRTGAPGDWAVVQLRGIAHCGTLGCSSAVYELALNGSGDPILGLYSHPTEGSIRLSRCGSEALLIVVEGHGRELTLAEWLYTSQGFVQITSYPYPDTSP